MPAYQQAVKLSPLVTAQVPEALDDRRRSETNARMHLSAEISRCISEETLKTAR